MKVVIVWIAMFLCVGVVATSATSCSVNHKSDALACTTQDDCEPGRRCLDGFCLDVSVDARIDGTGPTVDSEMPRPDGTTDIDAPDVEPDGPPEICPNGCTSCIFDEHVCIVDCSTPGAACFGTVMCPPTWNCDIRCNVNGSCRQGVNCAAGADCDITCKGSNSCRNLTCGSGACDVSCEGDGSCRNVNCGNACACDVTCDGDNTCTEGITCGGPGCGAFDGGCDSTNITCADECP